METKDSMPCLQESATGSYPELDNPVHILTLYL
jgi:hypothetical protein